MIELLELFGGIGACSKAMERCGVNYHIADYVEIDKYAVNSYNAIHSTNFEPQDITTWDKDIKVDVIMHGSPCQDFSVAGLNRGGDEGSGTRSSLMYETIRIVKKLKPTVVMWENVKNLLSKKHKHNFDAYLEIMQSLGYTNYYQVLNAKDYGMPQNRERVFTISIIGQHKPYIFPEKQPLNNKLKDMLENEVDDKYYLSKYDDLTKINDNYSVINGGVFDKMHDQNRRVYNTTYVSPTITTMGGGNTQPKILTSKKDKIVFEQRHDEGMRFFKDDLCGTLRTIDACGDKRVVEADKIKNNGGTNREIIGDYKIRKLTPKECWRLMGFDDADFEKAEKVNSNTQLYKQAGNSIVVNVLCSIINNLIDTIEINFYPTAV